MIEPGAAALAYARLGWAVLPCHTIRHGRCSCGRSDCDSPGKHPIPRLVPHGSNDASADADVIGGWWRAHPWANVAIATGTRSGLLVVDLDSAKTPGAAIALLDAMGPIDRAACCGHVVSGSGGSHYYFTAPEGGRCRVGWPVPGVDVRGDGGYVVAPPSLHLCGERYQWAERYYFGGPAC